MRPRWRLWLLGYACLVGASRVRVGAHHPTDVVADTALGGAVALAMPWVFVRRVSGRRRPSRQTRRDRVEKVSAVRSLRGYEHPRRAGEEHYAGPGAEVLSHDIIAQECTLTTEPAPSARRRIGGILSTFPRLRFLSSAPSCISAENSGCTGGAGPTLLQCRHGRQHDVQLSTFLSGGVGLVLDARVQCGHRYVVVLSRPYDDRLRLFHADQRREVEVAETQGSASARSRSRAD